MTTRILQMIFCAAIWFGAGIAPATSADGLLMSRPEDLGGAAEKMVTLEELRALPQVSLTVDLEFLDGTKEFRGPLLRDVVQIMGHGTGTMAHLTAINDYAIDVPLADFDRYDVILALEMDGMPLSVRDKGPIWVMYPINDHEELRDPETNNKLIWQLVRLEVQ